jgi:capsid assembly protease
MQALPGSAAHLTTKDESIMKLPYLLQYCTRVPWAMDPAAMATFASILASAYALRESGAAPVAAMTREPLSAAAGRGGSAAGGAIAVIPVRGAIVQRASQLGPCEGGTGAQEIAASLQAALADQSVGQILMTFDTPGGSEFESFSPSPPGIQLACAKA